MDLDHPAPELSVASWLNSPPLSLAQLRDRVVVIEAFQMLCPGCVTHGLPQAQRIRATFDPAEVVVLGLHCVFEHHDVMGPDALSAFVSEYGINFPVAIDRHDQDPEPITMRRYGLRGTPSLVLVDRTGRIRATWFGAVDDLVVGSRIASLLAEPGSMASSPNPPEGTGACRPGTACT